MSHKAPNHISSPQENRETSSTETRFNKILTRMSSKKEKKKVREPVMPPPASGQAQTTELVGGNPSKISNGVDNTRTESAHVDTAHFGMFHDNIRDEVQKLQAGLSSVNGAIAGLSTAFGKYGDIVFTVGERYEKDQILKDQIRNLEIQNDGMWKKIEQDRDRHKSEISELQGSHEKERSTLKAQAEAGEQEKEKHQEMQKNLVDQHNRSKQELHQELLQKKTQLENEKAEEVESLKKGKVELEKEKSTLAQELYQTRADLAQEKETHVTMQTKMETEITMLEKTVADMKAKYKVDHQPSQFYAERYKELVDRVVMIVISYFTVLPEKAIEDPVGTSDLLKRKNYRWARVPIADSECSRVLRLITITHIIFEVICGSVWQPLFSTYLWKEKKDKWSLLQIYSLLSTQGEDFQQNWKVSTLKMLDQLDDTVEMWDLFDDLIEEKLISTLQPLLDDSQIDFLKVDLKKIFTDAVKLGKMAERDQSPVYHSTTPSMSDHDGWKEYLIEDYDLDDNVSISASSTTADTSNESLFVSPKLYRQVERATPAAGVAATSANAGRTNLKVEVIKPGLALFADAPIFQEGASDWQRIRNAGKEAAKITHSKGRRQSMSTSVIGLDSGPTSPRDFSKMWSGKAPPERN